MSQDRTPVVRTLALIGLALVASWSLIGCHKKAPPTTQDVRTRALIDPEHFGPSGTPIARAGDEIVVAGQLFHTGTPVVLWTDPGGYDAYRTERRFAPYDKSSWSATTQQTKDVDSPNRYGLRKSVLTTREAEVVRGGGWPLELLQSKVDQFVIHYDVCGTSRRCFQILHDMRGLSVHFMLDIDGTIYQTLDLKERAWHAGTANSRSVGIEIANMGAYPLDSSPILLGEWYKKDPAGLTYITVPDHIIKALGDPPTRTPGFVGRPLRNDFVTGTINGKQYRQYDLTPQQYDALIKLTATLCTVFPNMKCDYPRDASGKLIDHALTLEELEQYRGLLGHFHVINEKQDPGPAFQWDLLRDGARSMMKK